MSRLCVMSSSSKPARQSKASLSKNHLGSKVIWLFCWIFITWFDQVSSCSALCKSDRMGDSYCLFTVWFCHLLKTDCCMCVKAAGIKLWFLKTLLLNLCIFPSLIFYYSLFIVSFFFHSLGFAYHSFGSGFCFFKGWIPCCPVSPDLLFHGISLMIKQLMVSSGTPYADRIHITDMQMLFFHMSLIPLHRSKFMWLFPCRAAAHSASLKTKHLEHDPSVGSEPHVGPQPRLCDSSLRLIIVV